MRQTVQTGNFFQRIWGFIKEHKWLAVGVALALCVIIVWMSVLISDVNNFLIDVYKCEDYNIYFDFQADGTVFLKYKDSSFVYHTGSYYRDGGKYILSFTVDGEDVQYLAKRIGSRLFISGEGLTNAPYIKETDIIKK